MPRRYPSGTDFQGGSAPPNSLLVRRIYRDLVSVVWHCESRESLPRTQDIVCQLQALSISKLPENGPCRLHPPLLNKDGVQVEETKFRDSL